MSRARTCPCDRVHARARLEIALAFLALADLPGAPDATTAYGCNARITSDVHAGIAASDAICCAVHGRYSAGDDHDAATRLLREVQPGGPELAKALAVLLGLKSTAAYGREPAKHDELLRAERASSLLVREAQTTLDGR